MTLASTSLWMGDITPEMDERFITNAFAQFGESVARVKILTSGKFPTSGHLGKYCFVEFPDFESSQRALHRLNGAFIPGMQGKRFKLNSANKEQGSSVPDYSLYVGNLSLDVNDSALFAFFQARYPSVHTAKVILADSGQSRGYGFVRFASEREQQRALVEMHHMGGLGRKLLRVSTATNKKGESSSSQGSLSNPDSSSNQDNPSYDATNNQLPDQPTWVDYAHQYNQYYDTSLTQSTQAMQVPAQSHFEAQQTNSEDEDAEVLEDPGLEINIGKENREFIHSSESFFTALEMSRWQPLDNITSEVPEW